MQLFAVLAFMLVLPLTSTILQVGLHGVDVIPTALRWFVFWGIGARLTTAAVRQMAQPDVTARHIFAIEDPRAARLVSEIGYGNLSIGLIALASLHFQSWTVPAAVSGALFFGLAGIQHVRNGTMNAAERLAMVSDLLMAILLAGLVALQFA